MATALLRGQSFRDALRGAGLEVPSYVHHLVEAGELSGRLAEALRRAVEQMQYDQRVAAELRSALLYPAILVVAGFAAVLLVFVFVIPQFSNLLDEANELPLLAEAVLRSGVWFNENTVLVARRGGRRPRGGRRAASPAPPSGSGPATRSPPCRCSETGSESWTPPSGRRS